MNASSNFVTHDLALEDSQLLFFQDDGEVPNSRLPVLVYQLRLKKSVDRAAAFEALFTQNEWSPLWRAGIFDYHHYHSTAHEVLGVAAGQARVTLGGESGQTLSVKVGDVLVLPAGTGHRCIEHSDDFLVVGAYPRGQEKYDIQRPSATTHRASLARIASVPCPTADPVAGPDGSLIEVWRGCLSKG